MHIDRFFDLSHSGRPLPAGMVDFSGVEGSKGIEDLKALKEKLEQALPQLDSSQQRFLGAIRKEIADYLEQHAAGNPSAPAPVPAPVQTPPPQPQTPRPSIAARVGETLRSIRLGGKSADGEGK